MTTEKKLEPANQDNYVFKIGFDGTPDKSMETVAYLFARNGRLIATSPLRDGQAKFSVSDAEIKGARLFFGPGMPKERFGDRRPTLEAISRLQAHEVVWRLERDKRVYELMPIPELVWRWWPSCRCRVLGRVVKTVYTGGGASYEVPVCNARVRIGEVDRLIFILPRLPDLQLWRLRDDLVRLLERPPLPVPPDPEPLPLPIEQMQVRAATIQAAQLTRAARVVGSAAEGINWLNPQPEPPIPILSRFAASAPNVRLTRGIAALGPQPEPPDQPLQTSMLAGISPALRSALASNAAAVVRRALADNVALIYPWICHLDWLWPWFYRCDEVAVVMTDANGRFEADVWYLCFGDHPDLYFSVDYPIDGIWESVYHPSVHCHTYWNFACGSEVTIRITDSRVPGCWDHATVPGKKVVIKSVGPNVSMSDINHGLPAADVAKEGTGKPGEISDAWFPEWSGKEVAFGGTLEPRVDFGTGLKAANITHYRWSWRWFGSADDADWKPIDAEVRRHYRVATAAGDPVKYSSVRIGPDTDGLFTIEPSLPADGESWEVLNEHYDLASAHFDSNAAEWAPGVVGHGQFELKLELYRKTPAIQRIDLTAEGVDLDETISPAPFLADEIDTAVPTADRRLTELVGGSAHVMGYRLVLLVDNRVCFGTIQDVTVAGIGAGICGFLEYDSAAVPEPSALISFRASHPSDFASFGFVTTRVITHLPSARAQGLVESAAVNGFTRAGDTFSKTLPVSTLLHELEGTTACVRAAFAETLHVYALVTDGYWRLSYLDAPRPDWEDPSQIDVRAFALTPAEPTV